jgi:site-specific DNA-adenine methylase
VKDVQPGDLVYLDPPYPESLGYGNQTWRLSDLLDVVDWITASSCSVILSNVSDIKRLLERTGFEIKIVPGPKATQTRRPRTEMIAHRFEKGSL